MSRRCFPIRAESQPFKPTAAAGALPLDLSMSEVIVAEFREHLWILDMRNCLERSTTPFFIVFVDFARRCRGGRVYNQAIVEVGRDTVGLQLHIPFLEFEFCNLILAFSLDTLFDLGIRKAKSHSNKLRNLAIHFCFYI